MAASVAEKAQPDKGNRGILKATFILGSSSVVEMALTIIRTKILAVLLGPAGVGLAGLLNNLMSTASVLFDLGTGTSATRSVADANKKGKQQIIGQVRTIVTLLAIALGLLGAVTVFFASEPLAGGMLGDVSRAWQVRIVALGVFFTVIAGIQEAFLNGLERYGDLAKIAITGNILGTLLSIAIAWKFRTEGIVYYVVAVPLIDLLVVLYFILKVRCPFLSVNTRLFIQEASGIFRLGIPLMASGLIANGVILIVRGHIANTLGLEAVGLFQVAWAIAGIYIGFVLSAMLREYYPRLTGLVDSSNKTNEAVNQQARLALWLTTPLLLGVAALAPLMVQILYSSEFLPVVETLRWMAVGTVLKVLVWSMGFIWVARGMGRYVIADALLWSLFFIVGIFLGLDYTGLEGIGWIYTASYIFAITYTRFFVGKISGFRWQWSVLFEACLLLLGCLSCIGLNHWLEPLPAIVFGSLLGAVLSCRALYRLFQSYINNSAT